MSLLAFFFVALAHAQPVCSTNFNISPATWISQIEEINRCNPLQNPGDARVFNASRGEQVRSVHRQENVRHSQVQITQHRLPNDHKGTLKYLGSQTYEMVFQLNFTAGSSATVTPAVMMDRVRHCLDIANPGLRGPNGEQLNLIAVTPSQANAMGDLKPPRINIDIVEPGVRGAAERYSSDFSCGTILHELLHFAGLCDEYQEAGGDTNASQCRALGRGDSIMDEGMNVVFDDSVGEVGRCDFPRDSWHLPHLRSPDPIVRELALRKKSYQIGNFVTSSVGLPPRYAPAVAPASPRALDLKDIYCTVTDATLATLPTSVDAPFNTLLTNTADTIEVESFLTPNLGPAGTPLAVHKNVLRCQCPPGDSACRRFLDLMRPEAVAITNPARKVYACPPEARVAPTDFTVPRGRFNVSGTTVHYRNQPAGRSMLHPAHFARIINGPCHIASTPDVVKRYNECARFSVRSSMEGIEADNPCSTRPAYCNQPDTWLGASPTSTSP